MLSVVNSAQKLLLICSCACFLSKKTALQQTVFAVNKLQDHFVKNASQFLSQANAAVKNCQAI